MKKLRRFSKKSAQAGEAPERITNETVAEHRERVLAGGRRFKYPVQYAKHRLVINAIIIAVVAFFMVVAIIWWQLYLVQNTSTFFYRITRVLPLPVAIVDGEQVRFSNYLVGFRSQEYYLQQKEGIDLYSKGYRQQLDYIKRKALDDAITDAYAAKLADEKGIKITNLQIDKAIENQRQSRDGLISQETYNAIVMDQFNWTPDEAREVTARRLLTQEVAFQIDKTATTQSAMVAQAVKSGKDFTAIAASIPSYDGVKVVSGEMPLVPINNQDGGAAEIASKLKVGSVSQVFRSTTGDGYYVVKLLKKSDDKVSYAFIKISLTVFAKELSAVKRDHQIKEFITISDNTSSQATKK